MKLVRLVGLSLVFGALLLIISPVNAIAPSEFKSDSLLLFPETEALPNLNTIFDLVNEQRIKTGKSPLQKSAKLTAVAEARAHDMQLSGYYAHRSPDGRDFGDLLVDTSFGNNYACENLDLQFTTNANKYTEDWLSSKSGHRECLLNSSVSNAGYAVVEILPNKGQNVNAYIVVAIHAEQ